MKLHWTMTALLGAALIAGCSDRGTENARNPEESQAEAPAAGPQASDQVNPPAPEAASPGTSAGADGSAASADSRETSGGNAGARAARPAPSAAARADDSETRAEPEGRTSASAPAAAPRPQWREVTVPAGTSLPLELTTAISSATARVETPVSARLRQAVVVNGQTAIPAGATLTGEVFEVQRAGRVQGRSRVAIRFNEVRMGDTTEALRTDPIVFQGEATKGEDATKIGVGAGIGAAIGGILGGGEGAAKGGAIGGAAGTGAVLATRGREVELASGTDIAATLATPLDVRVSTR